MKFAIIGTGIMGCGWITQCAMTGHEVHCHDANPDILAGVKATCENLIIKASKKFKIDDPDIVQKAAKLIHVYKDKDSFIKAAGNCDIFLEVIFEDLKLKCAVLSEFLPQLPENVVFWSNTSGLDINPMAEAGGRPARSIVCHGMNPVPLMAGVEVVPGNKTSAETVEFTRQLLLEMKKAPFLAPNIPGFWVNRLLFPQMLDAIRLLELGKITVKDGDIGMNTCLGHPQGAFKLYDFATTPTILRVALEMYKTSNDPRFYPPLMLVSMVKDGEFGASSGKGFYDWSDPRRPRPRKLSRYIIDSAEDMTGQII
ncbi:MAG: 3-hydroxyacyl-CoA dehydrogenase family protein [Desulfobacteraceae bacterium]|jgi:3-hydroxybutyryl-CoA dehydrogenase|nr:3-hydroxyacyl-CoA dehydrogenase family protein [Desulfobacteraceae bacterium]